MGVIRPGIEEGDEGHPSIESVAFCPTHPWAASGATDGSVCIWDLASSTYAQRHRILLDDAVIKVAWVTAQPTLPGAAAAVGASGVAAPILLVSTADGAVHAIDGRNGKALYMLTGHAGMILDFALVTGAPPATASTDASSASASSSASLPPSPWVVTAGDDSTCNVYSLPPRAVPVDSDGLVGALAAATLTGSAAASTSSTAASAADSSAVTSAATETAATAGSGSGSAAAAATGMSS